MSDSTLDDNDLTPTQEYLIAGIVILLFGSLYWFLNHGSANLETKGFNTYAPPPVISESTPDSSGSAGITKPIPLAEIESEGKAPGEAAAQVEQDTTEATPQTQTAEMTQATEESDESPAQVAETTVASDEPAPAVTSTAETNKTPEDAEQADAAGNTANTSSTAQGHTSGNTDDSPTQQAEATDTGKSDDLVVMDATVSQLNDDLLNGNLENPLVLNSITFDPDSTETKMDSDHQIKAIAGLLQKHPDSKVLIRGHTDAEGIPSSNKRLSLMRATAMGRKLVEAGADTQSIIIMGMGDTEPLSSNESEAGRRKNRRIDISITQ